MPPKRAAAATTKPPSPPVDPDSREAFEAELRALASKAAEETLSKTLGQQAAAFIPSFVLLSLVAIASLASQRALSPIYGAIPASRWHTQLVGAACFAGWSSNLALGRALPFKPALLLPVLALWMPTAQFALERASTALTARWGPLVVEGVTLFPLVALSAACVATYLDGADLTWLPRWMADAAPGIGSYGFFKGVEGVVGGLLEGEYVGSTVLATRVGLEMVLGASYALLAPSKMLVLAIPALLHTAVWNTHVPTAGALLKLNQGMAHDGWVVLDRKESVTGYVSVIESKGDGFRLLRCDHSLLGGEWVKLIGEGRLKGNKVAEPVYGVFAMLEAVRLVKMPKRLPDREAKALVM